MSWKKHFRIVKTAQTPQMPQADNKFGGGSSTSSNFSSYLPIVYAGHPNRIQRYYQFDDMDRDSDINAALDTIADFSTLSEEHADEPFELKYNGDPNESEIKILKGMMAKWIKLNNFRAKLWYMFRDTLKNGDAFFLRDPETFEWLWLDHFMVEMVKIDDTQGKKPDEYLVRGLDYNRQTKFGSKQADPNQYRTPYGTSNVGASRVSSVSASSAPAAFSLAGTASDPRQRHMLGPFSQDVSVVDAEHVIHLSLSVGNDINWPFGTSILEPIFKTYKQKELLEDSILIYRVQRAPERRIFYIDVGTMPPERAKRHIEMIKNEIHQRRIPNRTGGGQNILDAAYNPLSINDDYFFAQSSDGRGSKVETLPGGECLALDTKIPLLDGRTLTLQEIINEFEQGKQLWAYSCNPITGEFVPGMINWAGITRKNAKVVKLTFDNGKSCTVTPDHKFPVQGRIGKIEAQNLNIGDSMFPFETRKMEIKKGRTSDYTQIFDNKTKQWVFVHRMVANYFKEHKLIKEILFDSEYFDQPKTTIHHIDFNRFNNNPENLSFVNYKDHYNYHSKYISNYGNIAKEGIKRFYENMTNEEYLLHGKKISDAIKESFAKKSDSEKAEYIAHSIENLKNGKATEKHLWLLQNDPKWRKEVLDSRAKGISEAFTENRKKVYGEKMHERWLDGKYEKNVLAQTLILDKEIFEAIRSLIGADTSTLISLVRKINKTPAVIGLIRNKNKNTQARNIDINSFEIANRHILTMLNAHGLSWKQFRKENLKSIKLRASKNFNTNIDMFKYIVKYFNNGITTSDGMMEILNNDISFISLVQSLNEKKHHLARNDKIGYDQLVTILQDNGYKSWKHLKQEKARFNHKLVNIEWLDELQDTGTITIDGAEIYHNNHTFALDCDIVTFNSLGEITDLMFFSRKLARGLRVPVSYLNLGEDDSNTGMAFNDGKLGAAMIQEFRFTKYCMRWQSLLAPVFDKEFKRFIIKNGFELDWSLFELQFRPPQSFTKYRQIELDAQRVQIYQGVSENKRLAERFKLQHYLGLTEDEIVENEKMWAEENAEKIKKKTGANPNEQPSDGLSSVGVRPMDDGMGMDMGGEMPDGGMPEEPPGGQGGALGGPPAPSGAALMPGGGAMPQ